MFRTVKAALCCFAVTVTVSAARAQDDTQVWVGTVASGTVRGDLFVWLEGQARATDDVGGGSQFILRPAIGARIARDAHAVIGYAYVRTDPEVGGTTNEHRIWQQIQFVPLRDRDGRPALTSRTRLEQRMFEGGDETGWRLRQWVRGQVPIAREGRILAVASTEGFFNLNATSSGARKGVDQWRNFVGLGLVLNPRMRLEPGYLNQRVYRPGADRVNHIANATLFVTLR